LRAKNGLDNGVHFKSRRKRAKKEGWNTVEGIPAEGTEEVRTTMTKTKVHVRLTGKQDEVVIECDDAREDKDEIICIQGGEIRARFDIKEVKAWWQEKP